MHAELQAVVLLAFVDAFASIACTSFSSDAEVPAGPEGGTLSDAPVVDGGNPAPDALDAPLADFGCPAPQVTASLATPLADPFTHGADPFAFGRLADDRGPFGRFSLDLDDLDAASPADRRYFLAIAASSTHVCTSARVRVGQPPAGGATVVLLSSTIHRDEDMLVGFGGLAISGGALNVFAGFSGPVALGYPPPTKQSVAGSASDWHVVRIELDAAGDGTWSASFAIDGRIELQNVAAFPKAGAIGYGEVGFGPLLVPPAPRPAPPPVVVDYADLRFGQR